MTASEFIQKLDIKSILPDIEGGNIMKVAIPLYKILVAPWCSNATQFELADIEKGGIVNISYESVPELNTYERINNLLTDGVDVLICEGIFPFAKSKLIHDGVKVFSGTRGEVDNVLKQFLKKGFNRHGELKKKFKYHNSKILKLLQK